MSEGFLRLTRKWPEGAAVAALRDIDAVSHKKHRSACRRINQCFLKFSKVLSSKKRIFSCHELGKAEKISVIFLCKTVSLLFFRKIFPSFGKIKEQNRVVRDGADDCPGCHPGRKYEKGQHDKKNTEGQPEQGSRGKIFFRQGPAYIYNRKDTVP